MIQIIKIGKRIRLLVVLMVLIAATVAIAIALVIQGTLPRIDGEVTLPGLEEDVVIRRDSLGVPTVSAVGHFDAIMALGFLHAQDRFFQMDLMRRSAGGRLSELFGAYTVEFDFEKRKARFGDRANAALAELSEYERNMLRKYAEGVNQGLSDLEVRPFEYLVLGVRPEPWSEVDSLLVVLSMADILSEGAAKKAMNLARMYEHLPESVFNYFAENGDDYSAMLEGHHLPVLDFPEDRDFSYLGQQQENTFSDPILNGEAISPGSNAWVVSADKSSNGVPMLANDMHLAFGVPNTWYRVRMMYKVQDDVDVCGVTLPGVPSIIIGSNGNFAWGLTNSCNDTVDAVEIVEVPDDSSKYFNGEVHNEYETVIEKVLVKDEEEPRVREHLYTVWGVVHKEAGLSHAYSLKSTLSEDNSINFNIYRFEQAKSVQEVLGYVEEVLTPNLNIIMADVSGDIAWTVLGYLPKRNGHRGVYPIKSTAMSRSWNSRLEAEDYPFVLNPKSGFIANQNNVMVGGDALVALGRGPYVSGAATKQIYARLKEGSVLKELDMLNIQGDKEARFYHRWRGLLLSVLDSGNVAKSKNVDDLRGIVEAWDGFASNDSSGFLFVRKFREIALASVMERVMSPVFEACSEFDYSQLNCETALWDIVSEKRVVIKGGEFESWDDEFVSYVDRLIDWKRSETGVDGTFSDMRYGMYNRVTIRHPLGFGDGLFSRFLNMKSFEGEGGKFMPYVTNSSYGASQRMVVSPGQEDKGIFHMPGGQSGNPFSAFYRIGHEDWLEVRESEFLPGEAMHQLRMKAE